MSFMYEIRYNAGFSAGTEEDCLLPTKIILRIRLGRFRRYLQH